MAMEVSIKQLQFIAACSLVNVVYSQLKWYRPKTYSCQVPFHCMLIKWHKQIIMQWWEMVLQENWSLVSGFSIYWHAPLAHHFSTMNWLTWTTDILSNPAISHYIILHVSLANTITIQKLHLSKTPHKSLLDYKWGKEDYNHIPRLQTEYIASCPSISWGD